MKILHINRRTHLYLALFLLPWFLMYGVSSIPFSHGAYFEELDQAKKISLWTKVGEKTGYDLAVPDSGDLRPVADRIVKDLHLTGAYGAYRQSPTQLNVYVYTFWKSTQVKYNTVEKSLTVEDRRFRWDHFLTGMHAKGGFADGGLHSAWAIFVDLAALGMLLWVLTGLLMWWKLPSTRNWGWIALAGGVLTFSLFLWKL